jgi:hypothetical protein
MDGVENGESNYAVGNKKPPKHSQFVKGKSGNPSGRRKDSGNLLLEVAKELNKTATIKVNGKLRKMTNSQIIAAQIVDAAKNKNLPAIKLLTQMRQDAIAQKLICPKTGLPEEDDEDIDISKAVWTDEQERMFQAITEEDELHEEERLACEQALKTINQFCKRSECGANVDTALTNLKRILDQHA